MKIPISETHLIDCIDYIKQFPDKYFELAVVDPPYGIGETGVSNGFVCKSLKDKDGKRFETVSENRNSLGIKPDNTYFNELERVSVNYIIWGAQYFSANLPSNIGSCCIVWDKKNAEGLRFSDHEIAFSSFNTRSPIFRLNNSKGGRIHPTQKPVDLYKWILANYAKQGDKILDTHLGSQSSRIAAYEMGFDFYGCELDPDYFEAGNKRFEAWRKMNGQQLFDFNDFVI